MLETKTGDLANQTGTIDRLNQEAFQLLTEDRGKARELAGQALALAQTLDPPYYAGFVDAQNTVSRLDLVESEFDKAISTAQAALTLAEQIEHYPPIPTLLNTLTSSYRLTANFSSAIDYGYRQVDFCQEHNLELEGARAMVSLASIFADMGNTDNSMPLYERSLAIFEKLNDNYYIAAVLNNMCYLHHKQGEQQEAIRKGERGLMLAQMLTSPRIEIVTRNTLGEIFLSQGNHERAHELLSQAYFLQGRESHPDQLVETLMLLGDATAQKGDLDRAISLFGKALDGAGHLGQKKRLYEIHAKLAGVYQHLGNHALALDHFKQFHKLKESIFTEENQEKIRTLEVWYRTQEAQREAEYFSNLYQSQQNDRQVEETFNEVGRLLTSTLDLDELLDQILRQLGRVVSCQSAAVLLWRDDGLEYVATRGDEMDARLLGKRISPDATDPDNPLNTITKLIQPVQLPHIPSMLKPDANATGAAQPHSDDTWLGVPLVNQDAVVGILSIIQPARARSEASDLALVESFAAQAAIALQNASLYSQIQTFNEQLEAQVQMRTEDLQKAYEKLERLDQTKSDFITVTAHELRTPITVLRGYAQMLDQTMRTGGVEATAPLLEGIIHGSDRLNDIVRTMLTMLKIDSQNLNITNQPISLSSVVFDIHMNLLPVLGNRKQTLVYTQSELERLPHICGDRDALAIVFQALLENAIKYTPDGRPIYLSAHHWDVAPVIGLPHHSIELIIRDTGIGIAPDQVELIFTKFYRAESASTHSSGKTKFKGGGPGLGLAIARGIVTAHHGLLWAESPGYDEETLPGSEFHIILPVNQPS